jgi:hypothetical protein
VESVVELVAVVDTGVVDIVSITTCVELVIKTLVVGAQARTALTNIRTKPTMTSKFNLFLTSIS